MEVPHALHRATPAELKERLAADRRGTPYLLYRDGDGEQRIRDLGDAPERLTVGRAAGSGIPLTWDEEASRVHARLEHIDGEWTLVDDGGSRNGSFVNGERLSGRRRLGDGDTVRLGRTLIAFRRPTGQDSQLTVTAERDAAPAVSEAQRRVLVALCRPCALTPFAVPASNQQIADELVLGVETIKTHMRALFDVFGLGALPQHQKRATLAQRALETGAVSPEEVLRPPDRGP